MRHYEIVYKLGVDNNGVVTSWEARARGISTSELSRFCREGRLEHVAAACTGSRISCPRPTPPTPRP